jgi:hypothetical protein
LETKFDLSDFISGTTNIQKDVLLDALRVPYASKARQMSWTAGRETARIEDVAYSLLGILNV